MFKRMYLKRKLQKNPAEYVCIFIAMVVSMVLINIPGIFIDSENEGARRRYYEKTGGYDVVLEGVGDNNLSYLNEVEGITSDLKDGNLYIKISSSADKKYTENHISYLTNQHADGILVRSYDIPDTASYENIMLMSGAKFAFTLVGMVSIYYAYMLLLSKRKAEIKILVRTGITKKELRKTLLIELLMIYAPSLVTALALSNTAVRLIIKSCFVSSEYYINIVYDYSTGSFISLVFFSAAASVTAFILSYRKIIMRIFGEYFDNEYFSSEKGRHRYINEAVDTREISPERLIIKTTLFREAEFTVPCGIITVLTVLICSLMLSVSGLLSGNYSDCDIRITAEDSQLYKCSDEIENAYSLFFNKPYIEKAEYRTNHKGLVTILNNQKDSFNTHRIIDGKRYSRITLIVSNTVSSDLGLYEALVPRDTDLKIFINGSLPLFKMDNLSGSSGISSALAELNIAGQTDRKSNKNTLEVYVSAETFEKIIGNIPIINYADVTLIKDADIDTVLEDTYEIFGNRNLFTINDLYSVRKEQQRNDRTVHALLILIAVMMLFCGAVLIYVFASLSALRNKSMNIQLIRLGTSPKIMYTSTASTAFIRALLSYIFGLIISVSLTALITYAANAEIKYTAVMIIYNLILIITVALTHEIPGLSSVRKAFRTEELT